MRARLLFRDAGVDPTAEEPDHAADAIRDLGLDIVIASMAREDESIAQTARAVLAAPLTDIEDIRYRQEVLADCRSRATLVRQIADRVGTAVDEAMHAQGGLGLEPAAILRRALEAFRVLMPTLRWLRKIADEEATGCSSEGLGSFFSWVTTALDAEFFDDVERHLEALRFGGGVTLRARLDSGARLVDVAPLRTTRHAETSDGERRRTQRGLVFEVHGRDEAGLRALASLRSRGLAAAASAAAGAADSVIGFLRAIARELGFYVGCLNLAEDAERVGIPVCVPRLFATVEGPVLSATGLRDVALALTIGGPVVGNDVGADGADLIVVTGANGGGKSTFLRSVGQAQAMAQAGMMVAAEEYATSVASVIATHFTRAEDPSLRRGRLDDELERMSAVVDRLRSGGLLLCNESFASTNEREGSELARSVVDALCETGIRVVFVTHLFDLAHAWFAEGRDDARFLRAERTDDGVRTFRIVEGEPETTSYGEDVYSRVFEDGGT